jgi:hypothetical protein
VVLVSDELTLETQVARILELWRRVAALTQDQAPL